MHRFKILLIAMTVPAVVIGLRCGSDDAAGPDKPQMSIIPDSTAVEISSSQSFMISFDGQVPDVKWFVGTVQGGTSATGAIDTSGLYIAPAVVPNDSILTLRAVAIDDAELSATARVVVRGGGGASSVRALPADTTLSPGETVVFAGQVDGCPTDEVDWTVEALLGGADAGSIESDGSYSVPASLTEGVRLLVRAASQACTDKTGIATVTIAVPAEFKVELEDFTDSYDDDNGSSFVNVQGCSQASGNAMVRGLDYPGEWLEVPLSVPASGNYELVLQYATLAGDTLRATVTFDGCGAAFTSTEVDFVMDKGEGLG